MRTFLSKNFTLEELCESGIANKRNHDANPNNDIDNTPTDEVKVNLGRLARTVLQPIREAVERSIIISSGYRSPELNKAVGGSPTSQHSKGEAADINAEGMTNDELFLAIQKMPSTFLFGQCILEDLGGKEWVHVSTGTKREFLRTNGKDANGKVIYLKV